MYDAGSFTFSCSSTSAIFAGVSGSSVHSLAAYSSSAQNDARSTPGKKAAAAAIAAPLAFAALTFAGLAGFAFFVAPVFFAAIAAGYAATA